MAMHHAENFQETQIKLLKACCETIPTPEEAPVHIVNTMWGNLAVQAAEQISNMKRLVERIKHAIDVRTNWGWKVYIRCHEVDSVKTLLTVMEFKGWVIDTHEDEDGALHIMGQPISSN